MILEELFSPKDRPMRVGIMMSGTGSNAEKIIEEYIRQKTIADESSSMVPFEPVVLFSDNPHSNTLSIARRFLQHGVDLSSSVYSLDLFLDEFYSGKFTPEARQAYDNRQAALMKHHDVDVIVLAGYDWIVSECLWSDFLTVNVHPGDLRVKTPVGKIAYNGLGWIPSAKAILAGDDVVYTTVHVVNGTLDAGPILATSKAQVIPSEVGYYDEPDTSRRQLLGDAKSLKEVIDFVREHSSMSTQDISSRFPIYGYAKQSQELLKVNGDWVEFPKAITNLALGNYFRDENNAIYLAKSREILPELVLK